MLKLISLISVAAPLATLSLAPSSGQAASPAAGACGQRAFTVYFEEWKSGLNGEGKRALSANQHSFAGCAIDHVRIVGLAGAKGDSDRNQKLSDDRAHAIADLLVAGGWPRDRLEMVAEGDKNAKVGDLDKPIRRRVRVEVASRPGSGRS